MTRARLIGLAVTALLLVGGWMYYRAGPVPGAAGTEAARRGGQIVSSTRSEPRSFNRLVSREQTTEVISLLTQGKVVRINRATFELEPWLAERWESSSDGRTHTLHLRAGVTWSDGAPFTADDVLFSLRAVYDPKSESVAKANLTVGGQPIRAAAPDAHTVVLTYPGPSGPGLRLLDNLIVLPKHKLEPALVAGTFRSAWNNTTAPSEVVGTGPFVIREYQPGQRVVLDRNPRYWRKAPNGDALPYLDRVVLEIVPDQNAELLRLQAGTLDFTQSELRSEDYVAARRAEREGTLTLTELGVGTDPDAFWFCMKPEVKRKDPRFAFVQKPEFRQALSHAVNREMFAENVFLSAAVPIWGPITPGNRPWFWPDVPRYPFDLARAQTLLKSIGLEDRDGNGVVEDARGTEARFTIVTQRGIGFYERGTAFLRESAARAGIAFDVAPVENGALIQRLLACEYDAMYFRLLSTDLDPAGNPDFWLSSGSAHVWNLQQAAPATEWERRMDTLMLEQAATLDERARRDLFNAVQKIFAENLPVLYFAAPRIYYAHSARVVGITPSVLRPPALWNADMISVTGPPPGGQ
ncbi:MAG: ABC transporter substrate-binding protein [Vicinamibacterales bacterium]